MKGEPGPTLRVATYNAHGCVGTDKKRSELRIAEVIAQLKVDIVGLQELDLGRARSGGVDQAGLIAEHLGWNQHFQVAMKHGEEHYGHAVLSRYPMTLGRSVCLPGSPPFFCREARAALGMEVLTERGPVHVINTHFGLGRQERREQAELLTSAEWLAGSQGGVPLVLLGDFNSLPGSRPHRTLSRELRDVRGLVQKTRARPTFRLPSRSSRSIISSSACNCGRSIWRCIERRWLGWLRITIRWWRSWPSADYALLLRNEDPLPWYRLR